MKRFLLGSMINIVIIMVSQAVQAGANWTGYHVGFNAGIGFNDSNYTVSPAGCFLNGGCGTAPEVNLLITTQGYFDNAAVIPGVQIGYDYQVEAFVFGFEADLTYNDNPDSQFISYTVPSGAPFTGTFYSSVNQQLQWLGTLRARVGVAVEGSWLVFASGGMAFSKVESRTIAQFTTPGELYEGAGSNESDIGWTAGAGIEYSFCDTWSARFEYLYVEFDDPTYPDPLVNPSGDGFATSGYQTQLVAAENIGRFAISYRF